ncbi:hypothetical protein KFL_013000020 [Klebsormidium nitens]|uniref:Uncharacterized protein n=1 Tax=Klebsormidium nitens TaxID=105231 RepID=A0A1Y1IQX5_KLENI|nr:hypothetical protein KFL_013000020 [Klebsormidium nitens]|eukprot:GAQ93104.1 hypothetical protein KFL_013000020 [Klebsormidium nitens]
MDSTPIHAGHKESPLLHVSEFDKIVTLLEGARAEDFRSECYELVADFLKIEGPKVVDELRQLIIRGKGLGEGIKIRKTSETPPRVSVLDVIQSVTEVINPRQTWENIKSQNPEVVSVVYNLQFEGSGQRPTPVTCARGLVAIVNLLPGKRAAQFRLKCANVVVRYLGGDETLVGEIRRNREAQSQLPKEHPARVFGETVEAEGKQKDPEELDLMKKIKRQKLENELAAEMRKSDERASELAAGKRKLESEMKEMDLRLRATKFELEANTFRNLSQDAPPATKQILKGGTADLAQAACVLFSRTKTLNALNQNRLAFL